MAYDPDKVYNLKLDEIFSDEQFNCRGRIAPIDIRDLAIDIDQNGLTQPIVVQPHDQHPPQDFRIVVGHRRYAAFAALKRPTVPCLIKEGLTEERARVMNLTENLKRKDLNILQEAFAIQKFQLAGRTQKDVAELLDVSTGWVQTRFALLNLPNEIQNEAAAGFISGEHIKQIYGMNKEDQFAAVAMIKDAKIKGQKNINVKKKKVANPYRKKIRDKSDMEEMQDMFADVFGNSFIVNKALGWCAGHLTDIEFLLDIKEYADEEGIEWEVPTELLEKI